jgi:hypothetical protein
MDDLIDWIIEKNKTGYQIVNSVQRLQEMHCVSPCILPLSTGETSKNPTSMPRNWQA